MDGTIFNLKLVNMKTLALLFTSTIFSLNAFAQLNVEEAVMARSKGLTPDQLSQLQWMGDAEKVTHVKDNELIVIDMKGKSKTLLTLDKLNKALPSPMKRFPYISWEDATSFSFNKDGKQLTYNIKSRKLTSQILPKDVENMDSTEDGKHAFTRLNNLYVQKGKDTQGVTNHPEGIVAGQAIARYEFGIGKGTFWSPNGQLLAFYEKDERHVTDYPLVDYSTTPASLNTIKYPMAGSHSEHAACGIYNTNNGNTVYLQIQRLQNDEFYITNLEWTPDNRSVLVALVNRDQNNMELQQYNASNGELMKVLFRERDPRYVEPEHPAIFLPNDPSRFLWFSEKNGFDNLYLYDLNGKELGNTEAAFPLTSFVGFSEDGSSAFAMGTGENATEMHLFSIDLKTMAINKVTKTAGVHYVTMNASGDHFIDRYSSIDVAGRTDIINNTGKIVARIHESKDPLADRNAGKVELMELTSDDGLKLHARMIKPSNFDPSQRYPVVVYVYNGPHVQLVNNRWNGGAPLWMNSLAEDGFIVWSLDGRGSDNRGRDFEQAIHRQLSVFEMQDQLTGVEWLQEQPYVDAERMAVHGWSYGGFMTTSLMLKSPKTFKVGVAGGPVIDWNYYEVMYTERYMDQPSQNPEGYAAANLKNHVTNLEGDLLMIHGTIDDVVVMQHNMTFLQACVNNGVQVDFFAYPGHPHNIRGKDRVHLMTKVIDYIKANL